MTSINTIVAVCFAAALATTAASAATVSLEPTTPGPFEVGDTVTLEMATSSDFPQFFGYEGELSFDDGLLQLDSVDISATTFDFFINTDPNALGAAATQANEPSGETTLATFAFTALAAGTTEVSVDELTVINAFAETLFSGQAGTQVTIDSGGGSTVIPLPASLLLLLTGVSGLPVLRRARRRNC